MLGPKLLEDKLRQMQPLIIMGMHRSGTSLVVRLLADMGIHMGTWLSRDAEAVHFQKINRRIYKSVGSNWGTIDALISQIKSEPFVREQTIMALEYLFPEPSYWKQNAGIADYFGPQLWKQICNGDQIPWGWKDPRTAITFPVWVRVFPRARFLHIVRNGIDVAISTHRRALKQRQIIWKRIFPIDFIPSTLNFEYCFRLWERYISFVLDNKQIIPSDQYMQLRYEDLLEEPETVLRNISEFVDYPVNDDRLLSVCLQINRSRLNNNKYARPYHAEIRRLTSSPIMQNLNYGYSFTSQDKAVEIEL